MGNFNYLKTLNEVFWETKIFELGWTQGGPRRNLAFLCLRGLPVNLKNPPNPKGLEISLKEWKAPTKGGPFKNLNFKKGWENFKPGISKGKPFLEEKNFAQKNKFKLTFP